MEVEDSILGEVNGVSDGVFFFLSITTLGRERTTLNSTIFREILERGNF